MRGLSTLVALAISVALMASIAIALLPNLNVLKHAMFSDKSIQGYVKCLALPGEKGVLCLLTFDNGFVGNITFVCINGTVTRAVDVPPGTISILLLPSNYGVPRYIIAKSVQGVEVVLRVVQGYVG